LKKYVKYLPALLCWALIIPPLLYRIVNTGVIALFTMGAVFFLLARSWRVLRPWLRRSATACVALFLAYGALVSVIMVRYAYWNQPPPGSDAVVVVLGAKVRGNQPSRTLRQRLDAAARYLEENPQASCIVSGGQGADEDCPEAQVMAAYLADKGIAPHRIRQEPQSTNTHENLRMSQALLREGETSVVVVTNQFHQLRAAVYAHSQGLSFYSISSPSPPGLLPSYWVREWFGVAFACVQTGLFLILLHG